ncbi:MAG: tRNA (uridine(34)/cytosine(34)/5-carboxymethylaminomethyluridine(34)-2'-O)-methyltransferase TrmL [Gammaproteobacteria bacterium]
MPHVVPQVVLLQPEIPPNTGNVIRLCANTGAALHLIAPLGFALCDAKLRRAGLDYREWARVECHDSLESFMAAVRPARLFAFSTRGTRCYTAVQYQPGDALLFGPETRGLPEDLLAECGPDRVLRLPMTAQSRSLNLSNAVAVVVYEAWRQLGFPGACRDD